MRQFDVPDELVKICQEIQQQGWTEEEWAEHESEDWFQTSNFCGGFDTGSFGFGYFGERGQEYWFELTLEDAIQIAEGRKTRITLYRKDEEIDESGQIVQGK